jgi:deoxyadenosine/deoxycytidine kinase
LAVRVYLSSDIFAPVEYRFITIEGCIGAGKTTLTQKLAADYNGREILEQFEDNPFLPLFYADPTRHAFPVELYFMAERFQQLKALHSEPDIFKSFTVSDFLFQKSLIFAMNNLKDAEAKLYRNLFEIINPNLPRPDIILYLYAPVDKLMANIRKRGRDYEKNIQPEYLQSIQQAYMDHFKYLTNTRIVLLDTSELDFTANKDDYQKIVGILNEKHNVGITYL